MVCAMEFLLVFSFGCDFTLLFLCPSGRAGRVSNGRVYRMITRMFWREILPEYSIPEMQVMFTDLDYNYFLQHLKR